MEVETLLSQKRVPALKSGIICGLEPFATDDPATGAQYPARLPEKTSQVFKMAGGRRDIDHLKTVICIGENAATELGQSNLLGNTGRLDQFHRPLNDPAVDIKPVYVSRSVVSDKGHCCPTQATTNIEYVISLDRDGGDDARHFFIPTSGQVTLAVDQLHHLDISRIVTIGCGIGHDEECKDRAFGK